ncbi:hypothetical protein B0T25DRAFT_570172 [Lasiosphaeria hispida]|uniref:Uncharacterized protein n=1 Tax=Lasiosphaeria hispida TaxID=260671 RepID=A0AAJ0HEU4_9PEZI|nr:hypothetical protein B0T25DRAFT_570172 [Lasiosphaeria hispida]
MDLIGIEAVAAHGMTEFMEFLLNRCPEKVQITEPVVVAAAGNTYWDGQMLVFLFTRWGQEVKITEKVVKQAAKSGIDRLKLLLDRRDWAVEITEDIVIVAIEHRTDACLLLELLFARRGSEITITERIAKAAVCHEDYYASDLAEMFFLHQGSEWVTEGVVEACIENIQYSTTTLEMLLTKTKVKVTRRMMQLGGENEHRVDTL